MGRQHYSRRHYQRLANGGPDAPGDAERRIREREAREQANREMMARFAPLTPTNAQEAVDWQTARIKELIHK